MKTAKFFILAAVCLLPLVALADDAHYPPITSINAHSLGPLPLDKLPPVVAPVDNPQTSAKIALGKMLYFDTRLSQNNTVSCATCHDPAKGWSDDGPTSTGIDGKKGTRRAPPVVNAAYNSLQFWDGRAPSLEEQSKGPIENPVEMGNTHQAMVRTIEDIPGYRQHFMAAFGTDQITTDLVAKAIAAYERTVVTTDSPFDRYVVGNRSALTPQEAKGLEIFNGKGHCTACHWGPHLSDGRFHNLGVPATDPATPDSGRYVITGITSDIGAFKTPTVRDAASRAPFMHNGSENTLEGLVELYNRGGGPDDAHLDQMMVPLGLSKGDVEALVAFMKRAVVSTNPDVANVKPIPASELPQ